MASGLVGIGGGIIIVPALVLLFGFPQQMAQGTTLALMVPPLGALAAWAYYKQGFVDIRQPQLFASDSWRAACWEPTWPSASRQIC